MPDRAIDNVQRAAAVQKDAYRGGAEPLDIEAAQKHGVARAGIDRDGVLARDWLLHAHRADAVVDDAERLGDGDGSIAAWIEHIDLAARGNDVIVDILEGPARRCG